MAKLDQWLYAKLEDMPFDHDDMCLDDVHMIA